MILIVGGVSGTGKSTIGKMLAETLDLPFYDADDFHPESNVQKMQNGQPLNDQDRQPWLETLATQCHNKIEWIILHGSKALLSERLAARKGHFFEPKLLDSQLNTLELPVDAHVVDIQSPPNVIVKSIIARLEIA